MGVGMESRASEIDEVSCNIDCEEFGLMSLVCARNFRRSKVD
jgi:hypothetical protein